jgi:alpha-ketoglutarate-dependent taurine dioxygenase
MKFLDLAHIDVTQSALAAGLVVLGLALLLQLRAAHKLRMLLTRDLARIFEQLDLVRFESQQLAEQGASAASHAVTRVIPAPSRPLRERAPASLPGEDYAAALQLAASGADQREIVARCGVSASEARILVAMHGKAPRRSAAN